MTGSARVLEGTEELRSGRVKVWDICVRVFHWSLVVLFASAWITGGIWDNPHIAAGYGIFGLILMRAVWGFIGSKHARFSDFVYSPGAIFRYIADAVRMRAPRYLGHNPAGGAMVLALLGVLTVTCISGVMMTMDAFWGAEWLEEFHEAASTAALLLVALHVGGVFISGMEHRENLVRAMITGWKRSP